MDKRKAIPTEYKGVRFKSKSEAMFACMLNHAGIDWIYEPQNLSTGDYVPDFLTMNFSQLKQRMQLNVIEYKPSEPTTAYLDRVAGKGREIRRACGSISMSFSVFTINFFEEQKLTCRSLNSPGKGWNIVINHGFTQENIDFARSYRYDLLEQETAQELRELARVHAGVPALIAKRETAARTKRLQAVSDYLVAEIPVWWALLKELEDDKGILTCRWAVGPSQSAKNAVASAWESVGCEPADNVYHEVI